MAWFNLPLGVLLALLQRTPALRIASAAGEYVIASPAGQLLRAAFALASLGALHSRAGATTFVGPVGAVRGTVGTAIQPVAFTYVGTPSSPARFEWSGSLPPGLNFIPVPSGSVINSGTPAITGTPTQAGTFIIFVQGFNPEGRTNNIQVSNDELANAMRAEAGRYPGQEKQVLDYFRNNPQAVDGLRAPIFEEKVVDFVLELAKVAEKPVAPSELTAAAAG